jgi:predicted nucleic acid-binding protein
MKLIDTDVAIDHFHGHQAAQDYFAEVLAAGEVLAISVVTLTELMAGLRPGEEVRTEKMLNLFSLLEVDEAIGRKAGEYLRQYGRSQHLELGDALIAATASVSEAELVTRNIKHYPMTDIRVIPPYERGIS